MHLDAERIQRVLHGELPIAATADVTAHLAGCTECRVAVSLARAQEEEMFGLFGTIDHPRRSGDVRQVHAAVRRRRAPPLRWAAGFVAAVGLAGVAYALPSSPLRRWLEAWRTPSSRAIAADVAEGVSERAGTRVPAGADLSGVSISPGATALVVFNTVQSTGEARIVLADVGDIEVRAPAGAVTFAAGASRLTIENSGTTVSYEILIPRAALRVEIRVAGVRVWLKEGARVMSEYSAGPDGVVRIPLAR
ncbi:MAG: hypothetical protein Q8K82_23015 [Gemmatimonadaceae bacterium]|nr:hypothetical protein [Gemmatimonadaceae bacterium]